MKRLFQKKTAIPLGILVAGLLTMIGLSALKKAPEEKNDGDNIPIADVQLLELRDIKLSVKAYGQVEPKHTTELISQVTGEIVAINPAFNRGGRVEKGDMLVQIDPRDYESALLQAEAQYASAKAALETEVAQSEVAKEQWADQSSPTVLALRKPQLTQAKAAVKAALAAVQNAKRNLERTKIKSPYHSLIKARHISLGSNVTPGTPIGTVLDISVAQIRLPIPANDFQFLERGNNIGVELISQQGNKTHTWSATITRDEGIIEERSRMRFLVAELEQPYELKNPLLFGTYVNAEISGITLKNAARVPYNWLSDEKLITIKDESISFADVSIVRKNEDHVIIQGSFSKPQTVVTSALEYPVEGMKVKTKPTQEPMSAVVDSENAL
ncbi:efflux RND transporter periplasmic adaptor subunit [Bermanella marisrubri]|uniref:Efflux transporter, RND family, MFP subunit subfamily protein n=1 Tax=Bermanella marisrubri TaxID=207949 RepID=Q1N1D4_9GAMM|nr:efflux RND transporter periplasmic adaptor subunit [Bermanella marisrubri]EAT12116.1 efflux transporter, RND family, MFP subunit subfamily protein [Oceanobacter sp. RED65] [Bermanella marisrubri]QIZ83579.1 efflux RND transporter periplasmic adaptor subunit [Bermanella marisrubri]